MRTRGGARWVGALALLALVAGCGAGLPPAHQVVERAARAMAEASSYRLQGSARLGQTTTRFQLLVRSSGDFSGRLDITAPGTPAFQSGIVALGSDVYVLSPSELQELGISSFPGNLDPATTWVLQPAAVARGYRRSLMPFIAGGLGSTLRRATRGSLTVRREEVGKRRLLVVREAGGSSSLRLLVDARTDHLLELQISGAQPVTLRYSDFGTARKVVAPPASSVYVPPTVKDPG